MCWTKERSSHAVSCEGGALGALIVRSSTGAAQLGGACCRSSTQRLWLRSEEWCWVARRHADTTQTSCWESPTPIRARIIFTQPVTSIWHAHAAARSSGACESTVFGRPMQGTGRGGRKLAAPDTKARVFEVHDRALDGVLRAADCARRRAAQATSGIHGAGLGALALAANCRHAARAATGFTGARGLAST
jgi:hypothetical protein